MLRHTVTDLIVDLPAVGRLRKELPRYVAMTSLPVARNETGANLGR